MVVPKRTTTPSNKGDDVILYGYSSAYGDLNGEKSAVLKNESGDTYVEVFSGYDGLLMC